MSITLNSTLKAAQDSQCHNIILKILSEPIIADIPFIGDFLTEETINEKRPNTITHSSGRISVIYNFGTQNLKYVYTDTDRTYFNFIDISRTNLGMGSSETMIEASICELTDENIGIVFATQTGTKLYLRWAKITVKGSIINNGLIAEYNKSEFNNIKSPFVIKLQNDTYLLAYLKGTNLVPVSSGTYTGTTNSEYLILITKEGSETTAKFKWKKDNGSWSAEITCTGGTPQLLDEGVYINFVSGNYLEGMYFSITVTAARKARGYITILDNALDGDQIIIGVNTYEYKTTLIGGGNPNEVKIDILGKEISLENLRCAITDTNFEGTGEGIRYGNGTIAHPDVTASRSDYTMKIEALIAGTAGNSIGITVPGARFSKASMSGGADSSISSVVTYASNTIKKRTSSDFETWSVEMDISIGNITANQKDNVSLYQLLDGDIWILFDNYDDPYWSNCYYSVSTDNGLNWENATALTAYSDPLAKGLHPVLIQKSGTQVYFVYYEERGALHVDSDTSGWPGGSCSIMGIHIYNNKAYAITTWPWVGTKYFIAAIEIDIATWRITNSWTTTSTPAFHTVFANEDVIGNKHKSNGKYLVVGTSNWPAIGVLNIDTNTITHYFFYTWNTYGIVKNVNWEPPDPSHPNRDLIATYIDETNNRLYLLLAAAIFSYRIIEIVYIDLTDVLVPGSTYNITTVYSSVNYYSEWETRNLSNGDFRVFPNDNLAVITSRYQIANPGRMTIFDTSTDTWTVYRDYTGGDGSGFPYRGIGKIIYYNGYFYGTFVYYINEPTYQGLCRLEPIGESFDYFEPVWPVQYDEYYLYDLTSTNDGKIIIASAYGVTIFDTTTTSWSLFNNDSLLGFTPSGEDVTQTVVYDETSGLIFAGTAYRPTAQWCGLTAFSEYGFMTIPKYKIGTYTVNWNFSSVETFVLGYVDADTVISIDPEDNGVYAFWVYHNLVENEYSIKWAKETPQFDLTPYIIKSIPVVINRSIEADLPNSVTFSISHGHLFDPFNDISLWRNHVKKGRKLIISMGEKISGIDYWQIMGSFIITERSMITYEREKYPIMDIKGEDKRILWHEHEILVSTNYEAKSPEYILIDLLENELNEELTDIDIPSFNNTTNLWHQWIETKPLDIIKQICDRYGYFPKITVEDKTTCGKISDSNTVDHVYLDLNKLLTYTPDDTFSDNTTRIIVTCEGREFIEREFPMERVLFITGSMGWWGCKKTRREYYSENREKQVRNPEIRKLESAEGIMFELTGRVREYISEEDSEDKYVDITIEAPDLRPALLAAISAYIGASQIPNFFGDMGKTAAFVLIVNILASIANYQFEIWGNPIGYVRQSWQSEPAIDEEHETLIGKSIEKKIEEPLAYYINEAQDVANHEMLILKCQRKRIKISKITHLQDEEGDTIQIKHPYSGYNKKIFITNIMRSLKISESPDGDGHFIDDIEGWIIS